MSLPGTTTLFTSRPQARGLMQTAVGGEFTPAGTYSPAPAHPAAPAMQVLANFRNALFEGAHSGFTDPRQAPDAYPNLFRRSIGEVQAHEAVNGRIREEILPRHKENLAGKGLAHQFVCAHSLGASTPTGTFRPGDGST